MLLWLNQIQQASENNAHKAREQNVWREYGGAWIGALLILATVPLYVGNIHLQNRWRADQEELAKGMLFFNLIEDGRRYNDKLSHLGLTHYLEETLENFSNTHIDEAFSWVDYWVYGVDAQAAREFITLNLDSADLSNLHQAFQNEHHLLAQSLERFSGQSDFQLLDFATENVFNQFRHGFDSTQSILRNTWLVSSVVAAHIALLALFIKWLEPKKLRPALVGITCSGFFVLLVVVFGVGVLHYSLQKVYFNTLALSYLLFTAFLLYLVRKSTKLGKPAALGLPLFITGAPFCIILMLHYNSILEFPYEFFQG